MRRYYAVDERSGKANDSNNDSGMRKQKDKEIRVREDTAVVITDIRMNFMPDKEKTCPGFAARPRLRNDPPA